MWTPERECTRHGWTRPQDVFPSLEALFKSTQDALDARLEKTGRICVPSIKGFCTLAPGRAGSNLEPWDGRRGCNPRQPRKIPSRGRDWTQALQSKDFHINRLIDLFTWSFVLRHTLDSQIAKKQRDRLRSANKTFYQLYFISQIKHLISSPYVGTAISL